MNENLHTALIELQTALEEIHKWADLLHKNQAAGADSIEEAAKAVSQTVSLVQRADSLQEEIARLLTEHLNHHKAATDAAAQSFRDASSELMAQASASFKNFSDQNQEFHDLANALLKTLADGYQQDAQKTTDALRQATEKLAQQAAAHIADLHTALLSYRAQAENELSALKERYMANMEEVISRYRDLVAATADLADYLRSVNFPARLDKLDSTVASISLLAASINDKLDRRLDQLQADNQQMVAQLNTLHQTQIEKLSSVDVKLGTLHQTQIDKLGGLNATLNTQHHETLTALSKHQKYLIWFFVILLIIQLAVGAALYSLLRPTPATQPAPAKKSADRSTTVCYTLRPVLG